MTEASETVRMKSRSVQRALVQFVAQRMVGLDADFGLLESSELPALDDVVPALAGADAGTLHSMLMRA
ncbi:hypothetical protein ACVWYQ_006641 [Bradyrhizobium sp. USDA 3397]